MKIFFNPSCSKCREGKAILESSGEDFEVVEYLKASPTKQEILDLMDKIGGGPAALVRTKEELYQQLRFDLTDREVIAGNLARNPSLLERPIVVVGNRAVIGRPSEKVREFLLSVGKGAFGKL